jgi:hypothetical protein
MIAKIGFVATHLDGPQDNIVSDSQSASVNSRPAQVQWISFCVVDQLSLPTPGARKQNDRLPASGSGQVLAVEVSFFTSALAEITSSETFVSEKAPQRLPRSVAVSGFSGQLLMLV